MSSIKSYSKLNRGQIVDFQSTIWSYYQSNKRPMPFRDNPNSYWVTVSEIMLQQTQVTTVLKKFSEFIKEFPNFKSLASSNLSSVLSIWQGLGYNRRGKFLYQIAQKVIGEYDGKLPLDPEILITFPGIGKSTAGSIFVFATNLPYVFVETNIRRIMIHHFFEAQTSRHSRPANGRIGNPENNTGSPMSTTSRQLEDDTIHDRNLLPFVEATLDQTNPREWYYALMDYGSFLAKTIKNPNQKSKYYTRQSRFEGSLRQVRGQILKILLASNKTELLELKSLITGDIQYFEEALRQLIAEEFVTVDNNKISIKD